MKQNEEWYLKDIACAVNRELHRRKIGSPLVLHNERHIPTAGTDTDGWYASVGYIRGRSCDSEIWLDRYLGLPERTFYYGFYSEKETEIRSLVRLGSKRIGVPYELSDDDWIQEKPEHKRLRVPLKNNQLGHSYLERYPKEEHFFYGIYELVHPPVGEKVRSRLVERIVEFFETVTRELPESQKEEHESNAYPRMENRKLVSSHIRRERSGYLANLRKQRDEYECQICHFRFGDYYGVVGQDFAEAHHIIPLAKLDAIRHSTIDQLITVCANCHRMLHRLEGNSGDIAKLKRAIAKHRRDV